MQTARATRYLTREQPMAGDRIVDRHGRFGTVTEVSDQNREIGYGTLAVRWDEGVVAICYPLAGEFGLIARAHIKTAA